MTKLLVQALPLIFSISAKAATDFDGYWKSVKCDGNRNGYSCEPLRGLTVTSEGSGENVKICIAYEGVIRPGYKKTECYQYGKWNPRILTFSPNQGFTWHNGGSQGYYRDSFDVKFTVKGPGAAELVLSQTIRDENRYESELQIFTLVR